MFPDLTRDDVFRLETRRLWLRWPRRADVTALVRFAGDKSVAAMTGVLPHPYEVDHGEQFVLDARHANADGRRLTMAITPQARPSELIGVVGICCDRSSEPFIGYWVGAPFWDQGFGTEAVRALVDAYFAYTAGPELTSSVRVINPASRRVLEKCGFAAVGSGLQAFPAHGGVLPVDHFRLDRRKWRSLKSWGVSDYVPSPREACLVQ